MLKTIRVQFGLLLIFASLAVAQQVNNPSGGGGGAGSGFSGTNAQTISYTALASDCGKLITENGASLTLTLPAAVPSATCTFIVENLNASSLTVARNGLTINGGTNNISLGQYQWTQIYADGPATNWDATPQKTCGNGLSVSNSSATDGCQLNTAIASTHAQVQRSDLTYVNSVTGNTSYSGCSTAGLDPAIVAYQAGMMVVLSVDTPTTTTATLNYCGLGAIAIKQMSGGVLSDPGTSITTTGGPYVLFTNSTPQWIITSTASGGATPGGSATQLQYQVNATTFGGLANSSVPNAGELALSTTPTASATHSVFGLGAAIAAGSASGTYFNVNGPTNFAGNYFAVQSNGLTRFRILRDDSNDVTQLSMGDATNAWSILGQGTNTPTVKIGRRDGISQGSTVFATSLAVDGGSGANTGWIMNGSGKETQYNSITTAGIGHVPVYGVVHSTGNTGAITTATLCLAGTATAGCNTGQYHVHFDFIETGTACGTPGTGGVTFLLTWTDSNATAHSAVSLGMDDASAINAVSQTFHFQTTLAAAWASGDFNISTNGAIIQYATGYTACSVGTGTYQLDVTVSQYQ